MLCISTSKRMLAHTFTWLKSTENIEKWWKKYLLLHTHERLRKDSWRKLKKKVCWSAIGSDSQKLVDQNSKWVTSVWVSTSFWESLPIADQQTFFYIVHWEPLMCMMKKLLFYSVSSVFDHANAYASMRLLVEIHNTRTDCILRLIIWYPPCIATPPALMGKILFWGNFTRNI